MYFNHGTPFASNSVNLIMQNSIKIGVLSACGLFGATVHSQNDSLGLPGDNLDLKAVLSIFKQSSSVEDFEKRLNSADSKVNNLDLNGDNQVDYLRVVDYGKEDFHSIVIQDPVSKTESQDVAVIEIVKKDNNTAHMQIVGDETLYGKDYIIEPSDQAPLQTGSSNKKAADDVYADPGSSSPDQTHVMVNVWAWPAVTYVYSPGYAYWVSPWYWGYYPGWYAPWRPYGWYAYHRGFIGYNYGFYGYRRHYYAFPHAHRYYHDRRVYSGYVQKTAPHYGKRRDGHYNSQHRDGSRYQQRNGNRNQGSGNDRVGRTDQQNRKSNGSSDNRVRNNNRSSGDRVQNNSQQKQNKSGSTRSSQNRNSDQRSTGQKQSRSNGEQRVTNSQRSNGGGAVRSGDHSGGRVGSGSHGGGGRVGGGGGGRGSSGGGANRR